MIRARFYIRKDDCDNDYRPVKWPIKYPYWCSAESSNSFVLVAYAEDEDSIKELWPEAYDINVLEKDTEVNGSYNIMRKVKGDAVMPPYTGFGYNPVKKFIN